ncbi:unnamed protein product [Bursaphelenchus okinawaensis]|uniref:Large ribosomal subunit protein mL43 n=1 Tax=Bursaphelenchus okinawaensis TaxID=465554 RepID=A0A811JW29_9BILA|nr:unnamed protein product [Bursaphelenchus okinawaensis]CAG9085852.1 unnamed protein product [Bursaphelenchus okinawaensis]
MPAIPRVDRLKNLYTAAKQLNFAFRMEGFPSIPQHSGWARRAIPQLQRLTINFDMKNEASVGMRQFIEHELNNFARENPSVAIYVIPRRQAIPTARGEYANGRMVHMNLKGMMLNEVSRHINHLRTRSGEPVEKLKALQTAQVKSIQGEWSPLDSLDQEQNIFFMNLPQKQFNEPISTEVSATEYVQKHSVAAES